MKASQSLHNALDFCMEHGRIADESLRDTLIEIAARTKHNVITLSDPRDSADYSQEIIDTVYKEFLTLEELFLTIEMKVELAEPTAAKVEL